jgi:histone acetyltransferase (RNA polymerase elongator complex component)
LKCSPVNRDGLSISHWLLKPLNLRSDIQNCPERPGPPQDSRPLVIPIFLPHSGCPHRCIFCDQTAITAKTAGLPPLDEISNRIEAFLAHSRHPRRQIEISFYGGNFLGLAGVDISRLLAHSAAFVQAGRANSIRFSTRPDSVDPPRLEHLKSYPVSTVELGVQSMDDAVLALSRRGHTAQDTETAVDLLKKSGYRIGLQLMVGLPGDSEAGLMSTGLRIAALRPDFFRIYPTLVLAQSPLAKWYQSGRYIPLTLEKTVGLVKQLYLMFSSRGIRVVRMGLQDSLFLNDGGVVLAGPHHPAFGHLVLSAVCLDRLRELFSAHAPLPQRVRVRVHPKNISRLQGFKCGHLAALREEFRLSELSLAADSRLGQNGVVVNDGPPHALFSWLPVA